MGRDLRYIPQGGGLVEVTDRCFQSLSRSPWHVSLDITVPTLVVAGADDTIIAPREAETSARAIRAAQLELISHAGHLVAFEQPEEFNRILEAWLAGAGLAGADRVRG